jgi:hypothetical protein
MLLTFPLHPIHRILPCRLFRLFINLPELFTNLTQLYIESNDYSCYTSKIKISCRLASAKDTAAGIFSFFRRESKDLTMYITFNGTIK